MKPLSKVICEAHFKYHLVRGDNVIWAQCERCGCIIEYGDRSLYEYTASQFLVVRDRGTSGTYSREVKPAEFQDLSKLPAVQGGTEKERA